MSGSVDLQFFIPAESSSEAVSRIYSLTGASERGRGEKRALVALRDALRLDIDVTRTNADLGERIASRLDVAWEPQLHVRRTKVNLDGLNVLLEGAQLAFQEGSLQRVRPALPAGLEAPGWAAFNPAVSKIEAVTRIAGLTGAPAESLGPGSKERKSVLVNLADNLLPQARLDRSSKTRLARDLAHELGMTWTDTCYSTGETVSLEGLNVVLAGAERRLGRLGSSAAELLTSAEAEAQALVAALADGLPAGPWDGRKSVQWMAREGARGAHENEWQGWYYEARGRKVLQDSFTPSRKPVQVRYGNTTFDYSLNYVWDLKSHTSGTVEPGRESKRSSGAALLNDDRAIRQCVEDQGLGFLVLSGAAEMDHDGTFLRVAPRLQAVTRGALSAVEQWAITDAQAWLRAPTTRSVLDSRHTASGRRSCRGTAGCQAHRQTATPNRGGRRGGAPGQDRDAHSAGPRRFARRAACVVNPQAVPAA